MSKPADTTPSHIIIENALMELVGYATLPDYLNEQEDKNGQRHA